MKDALYTDRISEAGVDVRQIAQASVLIKVGDIATQDIEQHPVYALCRGLGALGFGSIYLCGASNYFDVLDEVVQGAHLEQHPGVWVTEQMASTAPSADVIVDLTNDVESHQFCAKLSRTHSSYCVYLQTGRTWLAIGPSPIALPELRDLPVTLGIQENPLPPVSRIAAGLALQELVMYVGKVDLAAPLESTVIYNVVAGDRLPRAVEEQWQIDMVEGVTLDVVGAGGTGAFFLESIVPMLGSNCTLAMFDFDKVGPENLHQGPYTLTDIGRDKVIIMAERIHRARPDLRLLPMVMPYQDRPDRAPKPTVRILCVDNWKTRLHANRLSVADGVPLLECGSSPLAAQARSYVPGHSCCLECRIPKLSEKAALEQQPDSCSLNPAPTLPGVNALIAGILALETLKTIDPVHFGLPSQGTITYDTRVPQRLGVLDILPHCHHGRLK